MERSETDGCAVKPERESETVSEHLDRQIKHAREQVERLCVLKAKAEALNILGHPYQFYLELALS